jgi:hypothetical protein
MFRRASYGTVLKLLRTEAADTNSKYCTRPTVMLLMIFKQLIPNLVVSLDAHRGMTCHAIESYSLCEHKMNGYERSIVKKNEQQIFQLQQANI